MMTSTTLDLRRLYNLMRQLAHPLLDTFIPVNYTQDRVLKEKKRLDPDRTRNQHCTNDATNARILNITSALGIDQDHARTLIEEAHQVELLPDHPNGEIRLASPMSYEDSLTVYVITRAASSLPQNRNWWCGMYIWVVDSASRPECVTSRTIPTMVKS